MFSRRKKHYSGAGLIRATWRTQRERRISSSWVPPLNDIENGEEDEGVETKKAEGYEEYLKRAGCAVKLGYTEHPSDDDEKKPENLVGLFRISETHSLVLLLLCHCLV